MWLAGLTERRGWWIDVGHFCPIRQSDPSSLHARRVGDSASEAGCLLFGCNHESNRCTMLIYVCGTPLSPGRRGAATARGALGWYRRSVLVSPGTLAAEPYFSGVCG